MRSMTFQVDDQSTGSAIPAVVVTITENADGSLSFTISVLGSYTGDLRGFFFDLADESLLGTLRATATSGLTEFQQANDTVRDLGNGANMQGMLGGDGGFDAGLEIGTAGIGKDDYHSFSFRLASSAGALTLDDFANVDFGVRLTSVGELGDSRSGSVKMLEHTTSAIDALDDANSLTEDATPNTVSGNVLDNDQNLGTTRSVNPAVIGGTYGTLLLNADGTYTYTLNNAAVQFLAVGETRTETFSYTARASDEATSSSTDSATLTITITGANDAPLITSGPQSGTVSEGDDGSSRSTSGQVTFTDADASDTHTWSASSALYGATSVDADGNWHYSVADTGAVDALAVGEFLADGFGVTVDDGHGGTASQDVAITIVGTNDPVTLLTVGQTNDFVEDGGLLGVGSEILFSDPDLSDSHTATAAAAASNTTELGTFTAGPVTEEADSALGAAAWSFVLDNEAAQSLAAGTTAVETYTVTISDAHGSSASQDFTFRIHGVNDTPDITGGVTTGLVYEDGAARVATGVLTATDVDNGSTVFWTTLGAPLYGFATVNPNGQWTYTLDNTRFQTQQLAQGVPVTDTFTVRAFDEFGAFDPQSEQQVTVTVVGTNDRPGLPVTPLALSVFEDGFSGLTSTSAFDIDNGATLHWSLNRGSALGYSADYEFRADSFSIQKNFSPFFFDGFDGLDIGDLPPPDAPDFIAAPPPGGSPAASYSTSGLFQEVGGKLVMDGANASAFRGTGNNALVVGHDAILNTNIDPANTQSGLKRNHQFVVEGVFDLVQPHVVRQQYGIQLTDGFGQIADDLVSLQVRSEAGGGLSVRLVENNSVLDVTGAIISQPLLPGSADQIRLRLSHNAGDGEVSGSYDLLDDGVIVSSGFLGQAQIFGTNTAFPGDDNNWIRAGLTANALDPNEFVQTLQGSYGTLTVIPTPPPPGFPPPPPPFPSPSFADLSYTPNNALPAVQALAQGESVVDSFFVRTVDQFGMSSAQRVDVTVNGVNDAPDMIGGVTTGLVYEDGGARTASGVLTATDVDHGSTVFWTTLGGPLYGFATVNANGQWTYTLDNSRFQTQQLAQGVPVTDTFTVRAFDEFGAFDVGSEQVVSVTVVGTNDRPNLPPFPVMLTAFEDGPSGFGGTSAFDFDTNSVLHWSLNRGSALGYFADYEFRADSFSIQKNFAPLFFDGFDGVDLGDLPPPDAPDFLAPPPPGGSSATSYSTSGLFQEVGGKLVFSGANATAFRGTGNNSLVVGNEAILNTNIDPANLQSGLKRNHQFVVEGVFDLVQPHVVRQQYGLQLTDGFGQLADDLVSLQVRSEASGGLSVRLVDNNSVLDVTGAVISQPLLPGSADQIRLRLSHNAGDGHVSGSYDLLDDGVVVGGGVLGQAQIFGTDTAFPGDDNNWIRAGLTANALDPNEFVQVLDGNYGTLSVSNAFLNNVGDLVYTPGSGAQALAQGESAIDSFFVRAVDQFGMSSAQQVNVTVHGANDAPEIAGVATGSVTEDGLAGTASAQLTATDVDHFAVLNWSVLAGDFGYGSLSVDNTGHWTYTLDSADPDLETLDQGETALDTFMVRVTDQFGAFDDQLVSITVNGADDGGTPNSAPNAAPDTDLVVEAGIDFIGLPVAGDPTASGNVLANDVDPDVGDVLQVIAVNGAAMPAGGALTLTLTYGSLQINANGSWTYTLDNDDPETNALKRPMPAFADPGFENVTYTVADGDGATASAVLSIQVNGTDDMPVPVADFNSLTESDLPVTVTGNVLANDFDPENDPLQVFAPPGAIPGTYGSLTLSPNGDYSYTVTPSLVNFLAAGEVVHDIFEQRYVVAAGGFGGFGQNFNTLLDIAITGTDEAPSFADGAVFEDGGRKASGEVQTTSVDLNAAPVWTVNGNGPMTQTAEYRYLIDDLLIMRNGTQFFRDDFGNGVAPPSAPIAANPGYFTAGTFQETGGRVIMDGSFAGAPLNGFVAHLATLNTGTHLDPTQGLRRSDSFSVEARFELVMPTEALQTYGVRLTDAGVPGGGNDIVEVSLRRLEDGTFAIVLRETDTVGGVPTILASIPFTRLPGDQLIVFTLQHAADSDAVTGSFRVINGNNISQSGQFTDALGQPVAAHLFSNGENWTRAQFVGLSPSHAQNGVYGTLSVESNGDWNYSLNNGIQNVQALAQGERVTDTFTVNVTDASGASETHTVAVDVFGTNDFFGSPNLALLLPFTGGGVNGAYVVEDGTPQTARGNTFVGDVDHGPRAHFSVTANAVSGPPTPYSSDYLFRIDELRITKDGAINTLDTFNDGFAPGTPNGGDYIATGTLMEAGGRAILDGDRTAPLSGTATSDLVVGNVVLVNSNQRSEDPQRGFKTGHDFTAEARFDFDANFMPDAGESFGISFTDRANGEIPPNQLGDDNVYLLVLRDETGNVVAQFSERDTVSDTVSVIGSITLNAVPLGSQIVLRLEHDTADLGRLEASFDVLDGGGNLLQTGAFAEALHGEDRIFGLETPDDPSDDEGWTRFQFIATGRDTNDASADGQYGTLSIAADGDWTYTLNSTPGSAQWANLQALNPGQIATESFNIRAVDAEGASNSRPLNISVIGTGEAAVPVNAVGTPGSDVLVGSTLADLITGNGGSDLLAGLAGADRYDYNSINDGNDTITDFTPGVGGDVLDIRDVLVGYTPDPAIFPFNFVQIQSVVGIAGVSTQVMVNADGAGSDFVPLVTLNGVAGLFLSDLMNNGNIILA